MVLSLEIELYVLLALKQTSTGHPVVVTNLRTPFYIYIVGVLRDYIDDERRLNQNTYTVHGKKIIIKTYQ